MHNSLHFQHTVVLWNLSTITEHYLDMSNKDKDLTFMKWSKVSSHLAIGTGKGNLVIYDKATDVKTIAAGAGLLWDI